MGNRPVFRGIIMADLCDPSLASSVNISGRSGAWFLTERAALMVAANKYLLREVRRLAIKDEFLAMRLRGRLVVPLAAIQPAKKKPTGTG